jgi:hypothetical protein
LSPGLLKYGGTRGRLVGTGDALGEGMSSTKVTIQIRECPSRGIVSYISDAASGDLLHILPQVYPLGFSWAAKRWATITAERRGWRVVGYN